MTVGVRGKLFTVSLVVATCVVLAGGAYLESSLRGWLEGRMAADLMRQARLARELLELTATATAESVDPVADRLAASTGARVTVMTADGILGDSTRSAQELMSASNRVDGRGPDSSDYSGLVDTDALHVALPLRLQETRAIVMLSVPRSEVEGAIGRLRMLLLLAGLITVAVAVLMGALASELASRKVRHLVENARAVVAGKRVRLNVPTTDELGGLAGSFNRLA
ncbi:MAG TPA: hypothetical protein VGJ84_19855, partial [Polyangiaceae bacterium]